MLKKYKCIRYIFIILGMGLIFSGCFSNKKDGEKEVKLENEYTVVLDKIVKDVDVYNSVEKRAAEETFIGEGIYMYVLSEDKITGYEGWYYYSLEDMTKLNIERINELLLLIAVCGPKERVYCVFGDKAVAIFDYKSIEDTKLNGEELSIGGEDKVNKIDNTGITTTSAINTGTMTNTKAYLIDYPILTTGGIIIKYEREIPANSVIEFLNNTEIINSTSINLIEEGIAKVDVSLKSDNYKIRSKNIYFGKYGIINKGDIVSSVEKIFFVGKDERNLYNVYRMNLDGNELEEIYSDEYNRKGLGVNETGTKMAYLKYIDETGPKQLCISDINGDKEEVIIDVENYKEFDMSDFTWKDNENLIFYYGTGPSKSSGERDSDICIINLITKEISNLTNDWDKQDLNIDYSSELDKIVFGHCPTGWYHWPQNIFIMNSDGSEITQLTSENGFNNNNTIIWQSDSVAFAPKFSPMGEKIIYCRGNSGGIWIMNTDGSDNKKINFSNDNDNVICPVFSPDGKKILFFSKNNNTIVYSDLDGKIIEEVELKIQNFYTETLNWVSISLQKN